MKRTLFRGRSAVVLENEHLRVTVMEYGGHIAEIFHRGRQVSPMWLPPWPTLEPSEWRDSCEAVYGIPSEGKALSCVMGHFLCLDRFGPPSVEEEAGGGVLHGDALRTRCVIEGSERELTCSWAMPSGPLRMTRRLELAEGSFVLKVSETLENDSAQDYPTAWTQHVTLGPPFLEQGVTEFRIPNIRAMSLNGEMCEPEQVSTFTSSETVGSFVTHLLDPDREQGFFLAFSSSSELLHGYVWKREDFPWIGIWEEVRSRTHAPWNGETLVRGMEFGVSPFPESRVKMIEREDLFGAPGYRWIPARSSVTTEYCAFLCEGDAMPENVSWDNEWTVSFL